MNDPTSDPTRLRPYPRCPGCRVVAGEPHWRTCPKQGRWTFFDPQLQQHEPADACLNDHCEWHGIDEPGPAYIVCPECWHRYPTARSLRRAYRRKAFRILWQDATGRSPVRVTRELRRQSAAMGFPIPHFLKIRAFLWIFRLPLVRAKSIYFCQECSHDFA